MYATKVPHQHSPHMAIFIPTLEGGGAEKVITNLTAGFSNMGIKVDLLLSKAKGTYLSKVVPQVQVIDLNSSRMSANLPKLVGYLRRERPDVMLSALGLANLFTILAKYIARVDTRVVVSVHSIDSQYAKQTFKTRVENKLVSWSYSWADRIVAVSYGTANDLKINYGIPLNQIDVIYNPVINKQIIEDSKEPVSHPFFQPGRPPVILGVGRLSKPKDFKTLIHAFAQVRQHKPVRLLILGEGEDRPHLEVLIRKLDLEAEISMPGFVDNPFAYMNKAGVFVMSSEWEGLSNVLIEAMACGCPVVSTRCKGGPEEILQEGKYGYLIPVNDVDAMAQAILTTLDGNVCVVDQKWLEQFYLEPVTKQYLKVFGISPANGK